MDKKLLTLLLITIALVGTTSYANEEAEDVEAPQELEESLKSTDSSKKDSSASDLFASDDEEQEKWDPDVVVSANDPGLRMDFDGAGTYTEFDPSCGPCVAQMKIQLRMRDATRAPEPSSNAPTKRGSGTRGHR